MKHKNNNNKFLIFCLPVSKSQLYWYWNVLNSSYKRSNLTAQMQHQCRPQELQLSLVAVCDNSQRTGSTAGLKPQTPNQHRLSETREMYNIDDCLDTNPRTVFLKLPVCSKEAGATQHTAPTCTATHKLTHDRYKRKSLENTQLH